MSVLVVGMSHRSAPVALLERLSMDDRVQSVTTTALVNQPSLSEAMIISTCNRLEVYAVTNSFHSGVEDVLEVLAETSGVEESELRTYLYVRYADAAAEHLMTVTSGLDSMVVGEQQIIGQVRESYQDAAERGTVGPGLHSLAQSALRTGKRVHTETDIDDAGASMVTLALDEAMAMMGIQDFSGTTALVLGAGAMASLAATHLGKRGVDRLIIANRTRSRAERVAEHAREAGVTAEVIDFDERVAALPRCDIAVSATASDEFTITAADITDITGPIMLADLSLPRDIDDAVVALEGVHLVNIESLGALQRESGGKDSRSLKAAQAIVAEEVSQFSSKQRVREVGPAVAQLRRAADEVTDSELARLRARLPHLDEDDFAQVSRALRRVVDKILHTPTVKIKELAAASETVSVETAIEELFGLGRSSVAIDAQRLPKLSEISDTPTAQREES
ncbi:glutamyl-tRNA reductase [Corynebacterium liangguodongii]|uniref:Glutamyl-tRNA reductase n=1 Tax=Corynebacterium liangguodongii TaxID=2079535 RepID=A0A2S0WBZ5_9CORY|nr:glutamyl-tRNA reductase [Corynebacterium liangguodongii]AWB83285.1 glutamyl-tRNA reductase [Corynebacterium liangguodongii]PWC00625.1 glutamyl-tRNA reductase [Corynebacterium liangguodongii]